jgi:hypothetical protein
VPKVLVFTLKHADEETCIPLNTRSYGEVRRQEILLHSRNWSCFVHWTYMDLKLPSPNSLLPPICHSKFLDNIWKENTKGKWNMHLWKKDLWYVSHEKTRFITKWVYCNSNCHIVFLKMKQILDFTVPLEIMIIKKKGIEPPTYYWWWCCFEKGKTILKAHAKWQGVWSSLESWC